MAARKKGSSAQVRRAPARAGRAAQQTMVLPRLDGVASDMVGLLMVVISIAMAVSLILPSSAPVTYVTGEALVMLFGAGAMLFPMAVLIFALTFFVDDDDPITWQVAFGLALITLAVLSIVSITYPGAEADSSLVLVHEVLRDRGGYVGGGIAWALLRTVGREVGIVVLLGVIAAGVVVCGFSISEGIASLYDGYGRAVGYARNALDDFKERREERRAFEGVEDELYDNYPASEPAAYAEPLTSYLGSRTSTVLTRRRSAERPTGQLDPYVQDDYKSSYFDGEDYEDDYYDEFDDYDDEAGTVERVGGAIKDAVVSLFRRQEPEDDELYEDDDQLQVDLPWEEAPVAAATAAVAEPLAQGVPGFIAKTERIEAPVEAPRPEAKPRKAARPKKVEAAPEPQPEVASPQQVADANVKLKANAIASRPGDDDETYELPPLSMLSSNPQSAQSASSKAEIDATMEKLQGTLREFGLTSRVVDYVSGPLVTTFRVEMGEGERVNKIRNLEDDIALTLAAEKVRIFAPIAGTSYVGIEIPNKTRQNVHLGDVLPYATGGPLEVAIGRDSSGKPVIADIAKMPHMLVAGTTGSGKSVMINSMIMSLLMRATPKQVRMIMVDPKRVEFKGYNGIPHLYVPVVTEPRQAASALQWAVSEMERRLKVFEHAGARNIIVYNKMCTEGKLAEMDNPPEPMPYLVIVIDELSDLMMVAGKDVEASIVRIAQLARAAGIHLVIATQRPSANVVTGLIKSNIDSRVALKVSSGIDSRVILDETGADRLLGNGDMLFKDRGLAPKRVLGCYTSDPEIEQVVDFIRDQGEPDYHNEILSAVVPGQPGGSGGIDDEDDPLIWEAAQIVVESQLGSTSGLQRRLKVGYARAGRIMDMLESKGVVGPASGSKPREVLLDEEGLENLRVQEEKYREV